MTDRESVADGASRDGGGGGGGGAQRDWYGAVTVGQAVYEMGDL